jgi:hypothetical protein
MHAASPAEIARPFRQMVLIVILFTDIVCLS